MPSRRPFPYPGSKSLLSEWIVDHMANHRRYVEGLAGASSVLFAKPRSEVEVYNDIDGDLVNFFRVLRDRGDELKEWLDNCPFSHDEHEKWSTEFYEEGERPDDDVERAGKFFYLRFSQWNGHHGGKLPFHHFGGEKAHVFHKAVEELPQFRDRMHGVTIESIDYRKLIDQFDSKDTMFYFDPLLLDGSTDEKFQVDWDPEAFIEAVNDIDGMWQVSCLKDETPEVWANNDEYTIVQREYRDVVEQVAMNYNPDHVTTIRQANPEAVDALDSW